MISYTFNSKTNILETKFTETVKYQDIMDYMIKIHDNPHFPRKLNVIIDARNVNFDASMPNAEEIANFNYSLSKSYSQIKTAILSDDPKFTSLLLLFQHDANTSNYQVKIFVLEENALTWLCA
jgi:hypothetical protein